MTAAENTTNRRLVEDEEARRAGKAELTREAEAREVDPPLREVDTATPKAPPTYVVLASVAKENEKDSWAVVAPIVAENQERAKRLALELSDDLAELAADGSLRLACVPSASWKPTQVRVEQPKPRFVV